MIAKKSQFDRFMLHVQWVAVEHSRMYIERHLSKVNP